MKYFTPNTDSPPSQDCSVERRGFLALFLMYRIIGIVIPFIIVGVGFRRDNAFLALVAFLVAGVFAVVFLVNYSMDIFDNSLHQTNGIIKKQARRVRGPKQYYVVVNDFQLRVKKSLWLCMKDGGRYTVSYAPRTKWLLSFTPCSNQLSIQ